MPQCSLDQWFNSDRLEEVSPLQSSFCQPRGKPPVPLQSRHPCWSIDVRVNQQSRPRWAACLLSMGSSRGHQRLRAFAVWSGQSMRLLSDWRHRRPKAMDGMGDTDLHRCQDASLNRYVFSLFLMNSVCEMSGAIAFCYRVILCTSTCKPTNQ